MVSGNGGKMSNRAYDKWKSGGNLSRREAMDAQCWECNGNSRESRDDCLGSKSCPLYQWSPWGIKFKIKNVAKQELMLRRRNKGI